MPRKKNIFKDDLGEIAKMKIQEIKDRYFEYSSKDISLYKPLPEWRVLLEDIETLTSLLADLQQENVGVWHDGYSEGHSIGYEEGMEDPGGGY